VFAGLWEGWKDPANGEWLHTCTIITGEPNEFVREFHTRMPVILPEEHHEAWLSGEAGKEILVPYPADRMKAWVYRGTLQRFSCWSWWPQRVRLEGHFGHVWPLFIAAERQHCKKIAASRSSL